MRRLLLLFALGAVLTGGLTAASGCGLFGSAGGPREGDRFGDRRAPRGGVADDDRETVLIAAPADSAGFLAFPAFVDSVAVRPEEVVLSPGDSTAVEVLVKGALPDACAELSRVAQTRQGAYVTVTLDMRLPRGRVCAAVARPYRFYLPLDGRFAAGSYVLTLNGAVHPFQIRERAGDDNQ